MLIALAATAAGFVHVLSGPDHITAIAPYAAAGKSRAWRTGVRWGFGHSAGVLSVALLALLLRDRLGLDLISEWGERVVGVMLIGIGIWSLRKAIAVRRGEINLHDHGNPPPDHGRAAFGVGTVHGLAGSSHVLGIAPALLLPSVEVAATYLVFFSVGSVAGMGAFSSFIGWIAGHPVVCGRSAQSALLAMCSLLTIAVGGFWLTSDLVGQPIEEVVASTLDAHSTRATSVAQ